MAFQRDLSTVDGDLDDFRVELGVALKHTAASTASF
jgi:hypothetical protein